MEHYNVTAQIAVGADTSDDDLIDALTGFSPAVGTHPRGWTEVIFTLPADNLEQAVRTGMAVLARVGRPVVSVEVMPTAEFDRRVGFDELPELLSVTQIAEELRLTRQRVLQMIDEGKLPRHQVGKTFVVPRSAVRAIGAASADGA